MACLITEVMSYSEIATIQRQYYCNSILKHAIPSKILLEFHLFFEVTTAIH